MPIDYQFQYDKKLQEFIIETSLTGKPLLTTPQLNKGSAFTESERREFGLLGKLPPSIQTLEQQTERAYGQFKAYISDLQRHIYLNNLHDTNQVLFYELVTQHLEEMMPLIYTPHIGTAVQTYSQQFRQVRGLFISYPERAYMREILANRSNPEVDLIVVTDGEAVLGIGDQGVGAINIPIAKLMVYSLCGGVNPLKTLPIMLDVGTNNEALLNDPLYLGWRHERLRGAEYEDFINEFIDLVQELFPKVFLHWEDFSGRTAHRNLAACRDKVCSFNDDVQGTGGVTLATILAAVKAANTKFIDQKFIIFGAGSAGIGIAHQLYSALLHNGLSEQEAKRCFWLIDRDGLIVDSMPNLSNQQAFFARPADEIINYPQTENAVIDLLTVINEIKPTVLIGCSSVAGAFTETVIRSMAKHVEHPIVLPLSNPTTKAEAKPEDIIHWTDGKALIATGSPFAPVAYNGKIYPIAQCNNSAIFPGIGLGVLAAKPKALTDKMLLAASDALSQCAPLLKTGSGGLLPPITEARDVAKNVALAVAKTAVEENLAQADLTDISAAIDAIRWEPKYYPLRKK